MLLWNNIRGTIYIKSCLESARVTYKMLGNQQETQQEIALVRVLEVTTSHAWHLADMLMSRTSSIFVMMSSWPTSPRPPHFLLPWNPFWQPRRRDWTPPGWPPPTSPAETRRRTESWSCPQRLSVVIATEVVATTTAGQRSTQRRGAVGTLSHYFHCSITLTHYQHQILINH